MAITAKGGGRGGGRETSDVRGANLAQFEGTQEIGAISRYRFKQVIKAASLEASTALVYSGANEVLPTGEGRGA